MKHYKTYEEIKEQKIKLFYNLLDFLGNEVKFEKSLKYRETPHSPTIYINEVNQNYDVEENYKALDTIIQQFKIIIYERNKNL